VASYLQQGTLAPGLAFLCRAMSLKHDLAPEPFVLEMVEEPSNPLWLLRQYWQVSNEEGHPLQGLLFRPLAPNHKSFLEKAVGNGTYRKRLEVHFQAVGVSYPATSHGSRRGAVQHARANGATAEEVGKLARIVTPEIRELYEDRFKHLPCKLKRVKRDLQRWDL
jgi:hypothetical protein